MAYGGRRTCSLSPEDLWGGRTAVVTSSRSHWGLSLGWVPASRRAQNARASDAGQRMTSLAAQGTEDEHTGCSHDGGELCVHCSPTE